MFGQVQINAPAPLILRLTYVFAIAILPEAVLSSVSGRPTLGNTVRTDQAVRGPPNSSGILTER